MGRSADGPALGQVSRQAALQAPVVGRFLHAHAPTMPPAVATCRYREYGFVHFKERSGALEAVNKAHDSKPKLDGKELQVLGSRQLLGSLHQAMRGLCGK